MHESHLQETVRDLALRFGWLFYHTHQSHSSAAGFPDCVMVRGDRTVFAELKVDGKHPTAEQAEWLEALHDAGCETYLWREADEDWNEMCEVLR